MAKVLGAALLLAVFFQIVGFCYGQASFATFYKDISHPACGYGNPITWNADAYSSSVATKGQVITTAVSDPLFQDGKGCGACYNVWCIAANKDWGGGAKGCTGNTVTVVVVDLCPAAGNWQWCGPGKTHFDMSTQAWKVIGRQTIFGYLETGFKRVGCNPKDSQGRPLNLNVRLRDRSHEHWQSWFFYYVCGVGTLQGLSVKQGSDWRQCSHDWGTGYSCQGLVNNNQAISLMVKSGIGEVLVFSLGPGWLNNHSIRDTGKQFKAQCGGYSAGGSGGGPKPKPRQFQRWRKLKGKGPGMHCKNGKYQRGKFRGRPCRTRKVRHMV